MSNQGGLKHVATEPTRLENKREGRRGAAGRAALLRRAPSDSDCSGETASLSADSGDRAIRPAPQPPPRGKSRSRRRGSEWEVLEGLKDGQRFEKRPEVFNGYLHKKRKWPLKGWHKRFFVVDGGILVYARSPTDVARGRLHGSVDVGLSVISAKALRRRIDIDADVFIYHLRAKTPDVFRTWLTVLKAHRLYRQHLLTFGARESVPKIHAPLEDLPPTDNSSRTTHSGIEIATLSSLQKIQNMMLPLTYIPSTKPLKLSCEFKSSVYDNKNQFTLNDWPCNKMSSKLLPLKFDALHDSNSDLKLPVQEKILCSNDGFEGFGESLKSSPDESGNNSPVFSLNATDAEMRSPELQSSILCEYYINTPVYKDIAKKPVKESSTFNSNVVENSGIEGTLALRNKAEPITTYCFSTHKKSPDLEQSPMRKSRKSTNLVKYKNIYSEPTLKRPCNTYMLLGNHSNKITKEITVTKKCDQSALCNIVPRKSIEVQAEMEDKKSIHVRDAVINSDIDKITEKLMMSIFDKIETSQPNKNMNVKSCINQVVKELYDSKTVHNNAHPVIALFKSLLEYWLKNTSVDSVREAVKRVKSIDRQSNKYFTKDQNTSSFDIENVNKQTQFHGVSDVNENISRRLVDIINKKGKSNKSRGLRINNDSSEKDRRIQEIERVLRNTVYICGTTQRKENVSNVKNLEKDIKITKTLIDNLEKASKRSSDTSDDKNNIDNSNSSSELPKIQDTLNHLISDTSLPLVIAKDFLSAYLDLLHDSKSSGTSSESTDNSKADSIPKCDVQSESIQRKLSKCITTTEYIDGDSLKQNKLDVDPGQLYLKRILDNITTIFCKRNDEDNINVKSNDKNSICSDRNFKSFVKDELGEVTAKKSVVIDLSPYNLEHVSMMTNPDVDKITSVTINLKEKHINPQETKSSLLRLKFSDVSGKIFNDKKCNWVPCLSSKNSNKYFAEETNPLNLKIPITSGPDITKVDLKPYQTSSDATSKDYRLVNSDHSLNLGFQSASYRNLSISVKSLNCERCETDTQSCYILSSLKKCPFQTKKKNQSNDTSDKREPRSVTPTTAKDFYEEISMFENAPRTIDEKFILLLLENLTLLSKSMPVIHKEINALYLRLRKKYDKIIKNDPNIPPQGLGLLGKIYNDEISNKQVKDNETQYDNSGLCCPNKDIAIETSDIALNTCDESLSADLFENNFDTEMQTDQCDCKFCLKDVKHSYGSEEHIYSSTTQKFSSTSTSDRFAVRTTAEKAVSNQNWYRRMCTKDCGIGSIMKYVLDTTTSSRNFRLKPRAIENQLPLKFDKESATIKSLKADKGHSNKLRQVLMKEIRLLSPSFKVSTQSQTEGIIKSNLNRDFKVYELFSSTVYDPKKSSSMFELNSENPVKSDDLKTIYRCTSEHLQSSG